MKKTINIIILFLIFWIQNWIVNSASFNAWSYFKHSYSITNNFPCSIKITRIEKCYNAQIINPAWASVFNQVQLRWWILRTDNSNCYEYNPDYIIPWRTVDRDWDIGFWTNSSPALIWAQINSTFEFDFDVLWNCSDNWSIRQAWVMSSIIWEYCGDWIVNLWETCDPNDSLEAQWWNLGCSPSCLPLNSSTPTTTCDSLTTTPSSWRAPLTTNFNCTWTNANSYRIEISNSSWNVINTINNSSWTYTFNTTWAYNARCYVNDTISSTACTSSLTASSWGGWWGGWGGWWDGWGWDWSCWDSILQLLNSSWVLEECDLWDDNWNPWSFCSSECKIIKETTPYSWDISISPNNRDIIIWDKVNPFEEAWIRPSVTNNSNTWITLWNLCVHKISNNGIDWDNKVCINIWPLLAWESKSFLNFPNFRSNITDITWSYEDNILITTIDNFIGGYFAKKLNVRVSRPSIATLWWWTSFVNDTSSSIADIDKVLDNWKNKNFVWVWISDDLSSETRNLDDSTIINQVSNEWSENNIIINNNIEDSDWALIYTKFNIDSFEKYNWINNVYIIRDTNFEIKESTNRQINSFSWAITFIVENWDLTISNNITYPENIWFIVKWWWNIIVDETVTQINWVYISIPEALFGWEIRWDADTKDVLTINWSLYWDSSHLVSTRIKIEEINWYINVWTIVSFGSSIFRQPAPLTWKFIWDYIDSQKVAE